MFTQRNGGTRFYARHARTQVQRAGRRNVEHSTPRGEPFQARSTASSRWRLYPPFSPSLGRPCLNRKLSPKIPSVTTSYAAIKFARGRLRRARARPLHDVAPRKLVCSGRCCRAVGPCACAGARYEQTSVTSEGEPTASRKQKHADHRAKFPGDCGSHSIEAASLYEPGISRSKASPPYSKIIHQPLARANTTRQPYLSPGSIVR